ncbi:MAG: polyhydroxyalkanoate depolymerase [Rickettsiaceae bacterium]|nr:polyhydroxyalkanoate depolymerase [Rickettsiaceae bacterium]
MFNFINESNNHLYSLVEILRYQTSPLRFTLLSMQNFFNITGKSHASNFNTKILRASVQLLERITRKYEKPAFNLTECTVDKKKYSLEEIVILKMPFCNLLNFKKKNFDQNLPKMLIVAPMAGHHATLLKNTVEELLPYFDVYITDWLDASHVPLSAGKFDMDDYIDYVIKFLQNFKTRVHIMAVCQPTVPVLAAVSIMSDENSKYLPISMTLMGGPIDARKNKTVPGDFAKSRDIEWFEDTVITQVPNYYPGSGRLVYPGFLQIAGFVAMNASKHISSHIELFRDIIFDNHEKVEKHIKFYDEYFAVMDLPAEYYLQTIEVVFQKYSLAKGTLKSRGRTANVESIKKVALLGIEGENDDIAAVGQTKAAIDLCKNIPKSKKQYYLQKGVGHYGVFSGSKFREFIVPVIKDFAYRAEQ